MKVARKSKCMFSVIKIKTIFFNQPVLLSYFAKTIRINDAIII